MPMTRAKRNKVCPRAKLRVRLTSSIDEESQLKLQIETLERSIGELEKSTTAMCIKERNQYTQKHMREGFEHGLVELENNLAAEDVTAMPKVSGMSYPILKCMSSNEKGNSECTGTGLKTFCVSAKAYQKLQGRFKRDPAIRGFSSDQDTGIPSLQAFAQQCTLGIRESTADRVSNELKLWKLAVTSWAEEGKEEC